MSMGSSHKTPESLRLPSRLAACLDTPASAAVAALGNPALLDQQPLAIFCSDLAHALRDASATVIGGFHTPVERACLEILLAGAGPLIVCPARGLFRGVPRTFRKPLSDGRLLLLSPFAETERRVTAELAAHRNRFVAALADRVLFLHATPGGKTEELAREVIGWGKPAYALAHEANAYLVTFGAIPTTGEEMPRRGG